eukprot:scaffold366_cov153-Skeletonema_menzelii.AAC.23
MVQVRLRVRPTAAYHAPNKVETITIGSHERLEKIQEKYSSAGNGSKTRLYFDGRELPLNSSVASQDFQDDDTLECCNSPAISAALSACMKDLEEVKKLSYTRRHPGVLKQLLEVSTDVRNNSEHGIWVSGNWTDEKIKARIINFAIMKAVVQRKDRWAVHDLPQCNDCQSLYDALQDHKVFKGNGNGTRAFRSQEHLFKPFKNNGEASTNWIMLWKKIDLLKGIKRRGYDSTAEDYIEEFVRRDSGRHRSVSATINDEDEYLATHLNTLNSSSPARSLPPLPRQQQQQSRSRNDSSLMDLSSPQRSTSRQSSSSLMDLSSPQPSSSRQPSSTPRSRQSKIYFPQYASGPFSVLAALHLAMHAKHKNSNGRRLLSLTEHELKRQAQRRCRSNLYDKGRIRGRSAFACMDGLVEKQLARKEIIRDSSRDEIEKWGLLTKGERLGQFCFDFDRAVEHTIPEWNVQATLRGSVPRKNLTLCLDNREDDLFLRRLKQRCEDENVSFVERDLPAGDYLFLDQSGMQECILPVVVERKSWSDLADSCLGKGRAAQRLECVKLGSHGNECSGNCQLDKMKRCGCSKILFIVEGERCLGSNRVHRSAPKCTPQKCCSACKSLEERHGIRQDVLEGVLTRLQVEHGCMIHYTKCFNDTTESLLDMRSLLQSAASMNDNIPYDTYASNARRRTNDESQSAVHIPNKVHNVDVKTLASVIKDQKWEQRLVTTILGIGRDGMNQQVSVPSERPRKRNKPSSEAIFLDDSDDGNGGDVEMLDSTGPKVGNGIINIDESDKEEASDESCIDLSESQGHLLPPNDDDCIDLCESQEIVVSHIRGGGYSDDTDKSDDGSVIELLNESQDSLPPASGHSRRKSSKRAASSSGNKYMLILLEWSEYDNTFHKTIERVWKEMQAVAKITDDYESQQMVDFHAESVVKLRTLVGNQDFPIISRRHLMAFTLWMQLAVGVQIRAVQRAEFANDIQRCLENCGSNSVSKTRSTATSPIISRAISSLSRNEALVSHSSPSVPTAASMKHPTTTASKTKAASSIKRPAAAATKAVSSVAPAAASMKHPAATGLGSDLIREARLKRFGQSSSSQSESVHQQEKRCKPFPTVSSIAESSRKWECTVCTMKNDTEVCDACEAWRCSSCTYVNKPNDLTCICGSASPGKKSAVSNLSSSYDAVGPSNYYPSSSMKPSPSHSRSRPAFTAKKPEPEAGAKKPKVCGACGQEGHNRGNATQYNCTAYYDQKEVERREKLERKRLEKLDAERQKIERLEREGGSAAQNYEEWLRQTEKIKESHKQADEYRKEELKRAKQKKARMEKQQQRRNNSY